MLDNVLSFGLQGMLNAITSSPQALLYPGIEQISRLPDVPAPSVWEIQSHNYFECAYVEAGRCVMVLADQAYQLHPDSICIIPPGKEHYEVPANPQEKYTIIWLSLSANRLYAHETKYMGVPDEFVKTRSSEVYISNSLKELFNAICQETEAKDLLAYCVLKSYFTAVIALILRQSASYEHHRPLSEHPDKLISAATAYIESHYQEPELNIEHIAKSIALNPKYFIEYMRKRTGITPYSYLLRVRMQKAHEYLVTTERSIINISELVGFTSPYHFSATFKRLFGLSPSQFRAQRAIGPDLLSNN